MKGEEHQVIMAVDGIFVERCSYGDSNVAVVALTLKIYQVSFNLYKLSSFKILEQYKIIFGFIIINNKSMTNIDSFFLNISDFNYK